MVDLNLIRTFLVIYKTRSVSIAAEQLHITQPSVSHNLSRLRHIFKDRLFNRTKQGMIPTPLANQLYLSLDSPFLEIEKVVNESKNFDPITSDRCYRVALTDIGSLYFLPLIAEGLAKEAPNISLEIVTVDTAKLEDWLITGKIDAAICNRKLENKNLETVILFKEKYICLIGGNLNESIKGELTLDNFLNADHAAVPASTGHNLIEEYLKKNGYSRKIKILAPQFSIFGELISNYDLIVTVPSRIGRYFEKVENIKQYPVPFELPEFDVTLHWYKRSNDTPSQVWFINFLKKMLIES